MAKKQPTPEQLKIIEHPDSCSILAGPGSGKTFTIASKIKVILKELESYQGVIAISYTNKASDELKHRCLSDGTNPKGSFFGTIHKFCIAEIIFPFANRFFENPESPIEIIALEDLGLDWKKRIEDLPSVGRYEDQMDEHFDLYSDMYQSGILVLESIGFIALYIIKSSQACRSYLTARYSHIFVDEYQDSKRDLHQIFLELHILGIKGVAVGDVLQAIFVSQADCLNELQESPGFNPPFPLSVNHRCHPSIQDYAWYFFTGKRHPGCIYNESRVFEKKIIGSEVDIAKWLNKAVPFFAKKYCVRVGSNIGILVHQNIKLDIIPAYLTFSFKISRNSSISLVSSPTSKMFESVLEFISSEHLTRFEIIDQYFFGRENQKRAYKASQMLEGIRKYFRDGGNLAEALNVFESLGKSLIGPDYDPKMLDLLKECITDDPTLESFNPPMENQVQLMTLHKSKGLEFDIVFHLDLYEWALPGARFSNQKKEYIRLNSDACLHYVGLTRSRKAVVLCTSTQRHKKKWGTEKIEIGQGNPSEFLSTQKGLPAMRVASPI
ncbi:MAG: ATP-dependent helicase [Bacteroidia bacterium]|nr:ATP-dependent helicase [Bacteroidia bacterium]